MVGRPLQYLADLVRGEGRDRIYRKPVLGGLINEYLRAA